jgi:ADP-ribose pyrophosphatase YjhB (NUDIX family)
MTPRFPLATVGALVTNPEGKVLIVRTGKWRGTWGVPGGKVEWGETLEAALLREFREEVGLDLERVRFALLQEAVDDPQFHQSAHFVLINYFAHSRGSAITPNHEIAEWAWFDCAEVDRRVADAPGEFTPWFLLEWARLRGEFRPCVEQICSRGTVRASVA